MGKTELKGPAMSELSDETQGRGNEDRMPDGCFRGNVYGTYVHGIFDREEVANAVVQALAQKKGVSVDSGKTADLKVFKESQYDLLAEGLREHLNMEKIYEILDKGV